MGRLERYKKLVGMKSDAPLYADANPNVADDAGFDARFTLSNDKICSNMDQILAKAQHKAIRGETDGDFTAV
jgi:hypothetical protein